MHHRLYYHIVWTTRDREQLIDNGLAIFLVRFLRAVARKERAYVLELGMVRTHVHVLVRTHPTVNMSRLVQRLKALSATVGNREYHGDSDVPLYWAKGYAAKTVSPEGLESVRAYLRNQPTHHAQEAIPGWVGDTHPEYDPSGLRTLPPRRS